jgi:hypothetical protein
MVVRKKVAMALNHANMLITVISMKTLTCDGLGAAVVAACRGHGWQ